MDWTIANPLIESTITDPFGTIIVNEMENQSETKIHLIQDSRKESQGQPTETIRFAHK